MTRVQGQPGRTVPRSMHARRVRVMLVGDHALIRAAVRQAIEHDDVVVVEEAESLTEALERAPRSRADVVLVDVDLGGIDGLQLIRELSPRMRASTFILLSASATDTDLLEAVLAGARGYLTKDMTPEALHRALQSASRGELVMPRAMAARVIQRLAEAARIRGTIEIPELIRLSAREREVLRHVADGRTDREIGSALTISPRTVESHVAAILRKLEVRNRAEAAMTYRRSALPGDDDPPLGDATA